MISRKKFTLTNILFVPKIRKNLVYGSLLNNHGFHILFSLTSLYCPRMKYMLGKGI